jgi:hypothetical protein
MEFVDGGTLKDEIDKGPMKLKEAVRTAAQVAEALKLAHSKEIVHRDIKSHNVMLTKEGDAKVLDFGLAKTAQSTMLTRMGSTLGTVAYMSPEQARGEVVDHRTDIWSLGVMLFEMVAGRLPFAGEYEKAVMYGILNEMPPPLTSLRTGVPMGLEWIVSKCLAKDPNERYQACADLIVDLKTVDLSASGLSRQSASSIGTSGASAHQLASTKPTVRTILMALLLPLGLVIGWLLFHGPTTQVYFTTPAKKFELTIDGYESFSNLKVTHDGALMVGVAYYQEPLGIATLDLRTGEKKIVVPGINPFEISISVDDQWIAYPSGSRMNRVRVQGGAPIPLDRFDSFGGSLWMPDGSLVASMAVNGQIGLWRIPASGESSTILALVDSSMGQQFLGFPTRLGTTDEILVTALDAQGAVHIGAINSVDGSYTEIGLGSPVAYLRSGHLLYLESDPSLGRLLARPFDAERLEFSGQPVTVEERTERFRMTVDDYGTYYSATLEGSAEATISEARLYVNGEAVKTYLDDLPFIAGGYQPRLSPDGSRVMLRVTVGSQQQLHELNLERGIVREFTTSTDGDADNAAYSGDGSELIFENDNKLFRRNANGSGQTVEIETVNGTGAMDWARSGDWLVQTTENINGFSELIRIDLTTGESTELDAGEGLHGWPRISPDERFISYVTQGPDARAVWVMSVEDGNTFKIAEEGAARITAWSRDGKYLFYEGAGGLSRVPITLDPYFEVTGAIENVVGPELLEFDLVSRGDSVFAIASPTAMSGGSVTLSVITDWSNELSRIAPAVDDRK